MYYHNSQDVADSSSWNYNKDPHNVIYAIRRYDFKTKARTTVSSGYGGAGNNKMTIIAIKTI